MSCILILNAIAAEVCRFPSWSVCDSNAFNNYSCFKLDTFIYNCTSYVIATVMLVGVFPNRYLCKMYQVYLYLNFNDSLLVSYSQGDFTVGYSWHGWRHGKMHD